MTKIYYNTITKTIAILTIFLMILGSVGCTRNDNVQENLNVHFIDVGQADAILIQQQDNYMLIDAGNNADSDLVVNYLKEQGVKELQYLIGTHPHEDHIGGLDGIIYNFDIHKIIMPNINANTKTFEDVLTAIEDKGLKITLPKIGDAYDLGEGQWSILAPNKKDYEDVNNYSIVVRYVFGNTSFLFMGDAEEKSESEILTESMTSIKELESNVLKVGHHGSNSSSSQELLNAVHPQYAVISVGSNNKYGHPHEEVMTKLHEKNIEILRTDENGTIIISSNGEELSIETEKNRVKVDQDKDNINEGKHSEEMNAKDQRIPSVIISDINKEDEIVTIMNHSDEDVDMTNWTLLSVTGNQQYTFPNGFIIKSNSSIRISSGEAKGTLQWGKKNIWNNSKSDPAELYDENGNLIYRFED